MYKEEWNKIRLCPSIVGICFEGIDSVNMIVLQRGTKLYCISAYNYKGISSKTSYFTDESELEQYKPITLEEFKKFYNKVDKELKEAELEAKLC